MLVLVGTWALFVARDARVAHAALTTARTDVTAAQTSLTQGDVDGARSHLDIAADDIAAAVERTSTWRWRLVESLPLLGRTPRIVSHVSQAADAAISVGDQALARADAFVDADGRIDIGVVDGRVELARVRAARDALAEIDTAPLRRAKEQLASTPTTWVPVEVRDGHREAVALVDDALRSLESGQELVGVLPGFLGGERERRYFLAMQNNGELRGTGGLIGFWAILTIHDGRFELTDIEPYSVIDRDPDEPDEPLDPVETSLEFARRYGHANAAGFFANVNLHPDLRTTARVMLDLYEHRNDESLDGVITVDPIGLGIILEAIGPVEVPEEVAEIAPSLPNPVPAEEVAQVALVDVYEELDGRTAERKEYHRAFAQAAFERILAGGWDGVEVGRRIGDAAGSRHIQVFSVDPEEQAAFESLGVAGAMEPLAGSDFVAAVASNSAGNKMDVHLVHRLTGRVDLRVEDGARAVRDASLRFELENPLPDEGMAEYIIGNCLVARRECFDGPPGLSRTWLTMWAPDRTVVLDTRDGSGSQVTTTRHQFGQFRAFDYMLEVPSRSSGGFEIDTTGRVELDRDGPDLVYRLTLWRQSKAIPDEVDLVITPPPGWEVADAVVHGGGEPSVFGFDRGGEPLAAEREMDGRVRVAGNMTADVVIEIRYTRSLWDRFVEWLRAPAW